MHGNGDGGRRGRREPALGSNGDRCLLSAEARSRIGVPSPGTSRPQGTGWLTIQVSLPPGRYPAHSMDSVTLSGWASAQNVFCRRVSSTHWISSGNSTVGTTWETQGCRSQTPLPLPSPLRLRSPGPPPPPLTPRCLGCTVPPPSRPRHTVVWSWLDAAPAGGLAGAAQFGFLGGQLQDLHSVCDLGGALQAEQHEVVAVVLPVGLGVVLQEAQVETGVREVRSDPEKLGCVFVLEQVVATQPDLIITGEGEGGDSEDDERRGQRGRLRGRGAQGRVQNEEEKQEVGERAGEALASLKTQRQ